MTEPCIIIDLGSCIWLSRFALERSTSAALSRRSWSRVPGVCCAKRPRSDPKSKSNDSEVVDDIRQSGGTKLVLPGSKL
jgi:hypothetical protein